MAEDVTDVVSLTPETLPLSREEETFCLGVIEYGGNLGAAVRAAYGKKAYAQPAAKGRDLINRPDIALRIKQLADATQEHALISLGSHFMQLARLRDLAVKTGDMRTGLAAEVKRGELAGFYNGKGAAPANPGEGENGAKFLQINFIGGAPTGAASPEDWMRKFGGKQADPLIIENPK